MQRPNRQQLAKAVATTPMRSACAPAGCPGRPGTPAGPQMRAGWPMLPVPRPCALVSQLLRQLLRQAPQHSWTHRPLPHVLHARAALQQAVLQAAPLAAWRQRLPRLPRRPPTQRTGGLASAPDLVLVGPLDRPSAAHTLERRQRHSPVPPLLFARWPLRRPGTLHRLLAHSRALGLQQRRGLLQLTAAGSERCQQPRPAPVQRAPAACTPCHPAHSRSGGSTAGTPACNKVLSTAGVCLKVWIKVVVKTLSKRSLHAACDSHTVAAAPSAQAGRRCCAVQGSL